MPKLILSLCKHLFLFLWAENTWITHPPTQCITYLPTHINIYLFELLTHRVVANYIRRHGLSKLWFLVIVAYNLKLLYDITKRYSFT